MGFLLRMNGTTDKLEIPQFQFDKVILDIMVTKKSDWGKYWSSNYGWVQKNSNSINDQWDTSNIAMVYKNGIPQTNLTPFVDIGERAVFTIKMNKIFNTKSFIFSHMGFQIHTGGEIYNIKYYLGDTLQAHYDINTGTVKDKSGNGFDGILTGGTWVDNPTAIARIHSDGRLLIKGKVIEKDEEVDKISQLRSNGDLIVYGKVVKGTKVSINVGTLEVVEIVEGARDILVHRYVHQGNKVIQPTGLNKETGLFTTTEPIALLPGTKKQVITAFNYQFDGSIPREWRGVDVHYIEVVSSTSFYVRKGSANGEILTYTNADNNLIDVNSFRFEYDFQNYQIDLSEYNIKKGKFNFKGTRHRPGWSYIHLNVNHSGGNHQHNFGTFADGRDYLSLDVTGLFSIEDNLVSARIKEFTKTEWNDSSGTWVNYGGSGGNVLNQSFDNPSFGILSFRYAMANGSVVEIYDIEHSLNSYG